jgi:hypothetical protein
MRVAKCIIGLAVLAVAQVVFAQNQNPELKIGENTRLSASGLVSFGYSGDYGDDINSSHGLTWGLDGKVNGYYYNPNFLSFTLTPYYNQSRNNSTYQSLTGASGIDGTANFFTGSHFPGAVTYRYDRNSTGTFGLIGQPDFTTVGKGSGFGVNWSALVPNMPTLSVGYSQGDGSGTIYGTNEETTSSSKLFNVHSNYEILGFRLNAFYTHNTLDSKFPEFLAGQTESVQNSTGSDVGVGAQHNLPLRGTFYMNYNRASTHSTYSSAPGQVTNTTDYTDDIVNAGANFHPTQKLAFNVSESYTSNLSGYIAQSLTGNGAAAPGIDLGSGARSSTVGGGMSYQFTNYLAGSAQATYYDQYYFGKSYTGSYVSGTVSYGKRLLNMFTFSGSVVDSSNGGGENALGFMGNVNFFHKFGGWTTTAVFSYAQNVQSILITYTTSSYNYNASIHRRLPWNWRWMAAYSGAHSGLTNEPGTSSQSQGYSTALSSRLITLSGNYNKASGISLLGASGFVPVGGTPGVSDFITFNGSSYGGGFSLTPVRRLVVAGSFNRAISNTIGATESHNNLEIYNAQLQYHLRRIGLQAGYTRFTQGISAAGLPANTTSYFVGLTRWFDFF